MWKPKNLTFDGELACETARARRSLRTTEGRVTARIMWLHPAISYGFAVADRRMMSYAFTPLADSK
jgi:hypothetical protein